MASTSLSVSSSGGQSASVMVDDVVQALEGRIEGLIANAIDARLSLLSGNANSGQPQMSTTTSVSSSSFVNDLTQRTGDLASMGSPSSLAAFDAAAARTSTGMPRMVNCLANSQGRLVPNFINTSSAPSTSVVWSCQNSAIAPEFAVTSLPSVLDAVSSSNDSSMVPLPLPATLFSPSLARFGLVQTFDFAHVYRQFSGSAWCEYDKAFRQHAAASKLTDWSGINVQLFNFHTAGSGPHSYVASSVSRTGSSFEPQGNQNSDCSVVCLSWNKGHCVAWAAVCRFKTRLFEVFRTAS